MPGVRSWVGGLLLRTPASLRSIRSVPVIGKLVHRISHRFLPGDEKIWAQIEAGPAKGLWIELSPRTGHSYLRGHSEATVQTVLAEKLQPGMVFYDLGANIGLYSILAARIVEPSGQVFSFEPDPQIAERLERNIHGNEFQNVTVVRKGVWSASGMRAFLPTDMSSPDRGLGKFVEQETEASTLVECVALDDFVRQAPGPHAIKCDVEGAEEEVFCGAKRTLEVYRPWILCELHSDESALWVRNRLKDSGYTIEQVDRGHILALPSKEN